MASTAPSTAVVENDLWIVAVDTAVLALTAVGAGFILIAMAWTEIKGRGSTVRTRLVQCLVVSDFLLGLFGLITSADYLNDNNIGGPKFCGAMGTLLVAVLWTQHINTLALAASTYLILLYPLSNATRLLERRWYLVWPIVWIPSLAVGVIGLTVYGYYPSGGICYYKNGLYSDLIQFIPRGIVFAFITFFYYRLFMFLRRPDKIKAQFSPSPSGNTYGSDSGDQSRRRRRSSVAETAKKLKESLAKFSMKRDSTTSELTVQPVTEKAAMKAEGSDQKSGNDTGRDLEIGLGTNKKSALKSDKRRRATILREGTGGFGTETQKSVNIVTQAPWERIELPPFVVDGESSVSPTLSPMARRASPAGGIWSEWKGIGGRPSGDQVRPSTPLGVESPMGGFTQAEKGLGFTEPESRRPSLPPPSMPSPVEEAAEITFLPDPSERQSGQSGQSDAPPESIGPDHPSYGQQPFEVPALVASSQLSDRSSFSAPSASTPVTNSGFDPNVRRPSYISPSETADSRRGSTATWMQSPKAGTASGMGNTKQTLSAIQTSSIDRDPSWVEMGAVSVDMDDDAEMDFADILREAGSAERIYRRRDTAETEIIQESMASYLNRKTSLLMLYFPLAYIILFTASLIRLIYDIASTNEVPTSLKAISRWMIFSQGIADGFIYGFVEWKTKRSVRKKVRRGLISPGNSRNSNHNQNSHSRGASQSESNPNMISNIMRSVGGGSRGAVGTQVRTGSDTSTPVPSTPRQGRFMSG